MYEDELERIALKAETLKKVKKFFSNDIPKEKKKASEDIILRMTEILYMMTMLEEDVQRNGTKISGGKMNPSVGAYNNLVKSYIALFKQITAFLGIDSTNKSDDLIAFINSNKE